MVSLSKSDDNVANIEMFEMIIEAEQSMLSYEEQYNDIKGERVELSGPLSSGHIYAPLTLEEKEAKEEFYEKYKASKIKFEKLSNSLDVERKNKFDEYVADKDKVENAGPGWWLLRFFSLISLFVVTPIMFFTGSAYTITLGCVSLAIVIVSLRKEYLAKRIAEEVFNVKWGLVSEAVGITNKEETKTYSLPFGMTVTVGYCHENEQEAS